MGHLRLPAGWRAPATPSTKATAELLKMDMVAYILPPFLPGLKPLYFCILHLLESKV